MDDLITLADIERTRVGLPDVVRRTPILPLARESAEVGAEHLFLKCENLQVTGAYKVRAAFAVMNALTAEQRGRGVVLASSGNFAQAFAYAGALTGTPIVIVMLDRASPYKVEATRGYGAEIVFCGDDPLARQPTVDRIGRERGMTAIDTWEERPIAMGHGSIGLEIVEDMPAVETILVPVSSGGAAAGIAAAVKLRRPDVRVVGVQPERANAAQISLERGEPTTIDHWNSIADGLSAVRPGVFPFRHLQTFLDGIVLVSERDIAVAFRTLLYRAKVLAEPAGVVAAAAFLSGRVPQDRRTVAAVTGGNVTEAMMLRMLDMSA
ncbi:MAG: threonine/serine dehydratase [Alphaproteobacteria bacterium]